MEALSPTSITSYPFRNDSNLQALFALQDITNCNHLSQHRKPMEYVGGSEHFGLDDMFSLKDMDRSYHSLGSNRLSQQRSWSNSQMNKSLCCVGKKISDLNGMRKSESYASNLSNMFSPVATLAKSKSQGSLDHLLKSSAKRQKYTIKLDPLETSSKRDSRLRRNTDNSRSCPHKTSDEPKASPSLSVEVPYLDFVNSCPSPPLVPVPRQKLSESELFEDLDRMMTPITTMSRPHCRLSSRRNDLPSFLSPVETIVDESV